MFGVSYDGLTTAMTLLQPHPALKAISEQASPADQWMNDDDHRYGALRESYAFEYAVLRAGGQEREHALRLRDLRHLLLVSRARPAVEHQREVPARIDSVLELDRRASRLRRVLEGRSVGARSCKGAFVPNLNVAGFWDQEDPWGPWQIFRHAAEQRSQPHNFMVAGPWFHGQWHNPKAESIGQISFGGHDTARRVPREDRGAVVPLLAARQGREASVAGVDVPDRIESAGRPTPRGRRTATATNLYLHADGTLSFDAPPAGRQLSRVRLRSGEPGAVSRSGRSRRPIRPATGAVGSRRTSASSTTARTC